MGGDFRETARHSVGLLGSPYHNMGPCGRPGGGPNAWKHFGPGYFAWYIAAGVYRIEVHGCGCPKGYDYEDCPSSGPGNCVPGCACTGDIDSCEYQCHDGKCFRGLQDGSGKQEQFQCPT